VLIWVWAGGAGLIAILAMIRLVRFQQMLAAMLPASRRIRSIVDELASHMGIRRSPDVRVVDSAVSPFVWCFVGRATVVLPQRLLGLKQACAVVQSASFSPRISARERCVPACFAGGENHYLHVAWG
jgi:hypothetical protein